MTPTEKLLSLFDAHAFRTQSELGWKNGRWPRGREEAVARLQEAGRLVKSGTRYYLDASPEREAARIEALARKSVQLLTKKTLIGNLRGGHTPPFFREALEALVDGRKLLRWEVTGQAALGFLYLHRERLPAPRAEQPTEPPPEGVEEKILAAYKTVSVRDNRASIWISDLISQSGLSQEVVHEWIRQRVIVKGLGTLDEADWPSVTEAQRAASIEYNGRRRLLIRLHL